MNSGIYKIINKVTGDCYIGSAKNLIKRKREHFYNLRVGKHCNIILQRAFNKYKEENFVFEIITNCSESRLLAEEQNYIDVIKPRYNICAKAGSRLGTSHSDQSKEKMRLRKIGKKLTPEHIAKVRATVIGRKHSEESKRSRVANNPNTILNEDIVRNMKLDFKDGMKIREVAEKYSIKMSTATNVKCGVTWKHIQL